MTQKRTTIWIAVAIALIALVPAAWAATQDGASSVITTQDGGGMGGDGGGMGGDGGHGDGGGDGGGHGDGGGGGGHGDGPGEIELHQRTFFATEHGGLAMISVQRSGGDVGPVTVDYATADGTAIDGEDYVGTTGTLSWDDGEFMMQTFWVEIIQDDIEEGDETIEISIFNPTGGAVIDPDHSDAVLTVLDDGHTGGGGGGGHGGGGGGGMDSAGEIGFAHHSNQVIEGVTNALVIVRRSYGFEGAVTVDFETTDGSATAGVDYEAVMGTLSWADGEMGPQEILIPIFDDDIEEGNETVAITLSNLVGDADLDDPSTTLTILDRDGSTTPCQPGDDMACMLGGRFQVDIVWRTEDGHSGHGTQMGISNNTTLFWFFDESNIELIVKVLDACDIEGFETYWVFMSALTNVDFTMTVTDTGSGVVKEYSNPLGETAMPVQDTLPFETCN